MKASILLLNVQNCGKKGMKHFTLPIVFFIYSVLLKLARILHVFYIKGKSLSNHWNTWWNIFLEADFYSCLKSFSISTAMKHFYSKISLSCSKASGFWCINSLWISDIKNQARVCLLSVKYIQSILKLL